MVLKFLTVRLHVWHNHKYKHKMDCVQTTNNADTHTIKLENRGQTRRISIFRYVFFGYFFYYYSNESFKDKLHQRKEMKGVERRQILAEVETRHNSGLGYFLFLFYFIPFFFLSLLNIYYKQDHQHHQQQGAQNATCLELLV